MPSAPTSSPAPQPAVIVEDLVMSYGTKNAVDGLSLVVQRGTITAVLGPNGAGKTTMLETCEGYRRAQSGRVRVLGLDPIADHTKLVPRIGVMLQGGGAWSGARATEMLRHIASLHADPLDVDDLGERLGLNDCGRTPFRRLSGGQQQRLGLAMAVVGRPEVVFVDEPTAGMDPAARRTTWELLEELREHGVSVVLTTHYLDEAERLADEVHIIDRGRLVASGSPGQLTSSSSRGGGGVIRLVSSRPLADSDLGDLAELVPDSVTLTRCDEDSAVLAGAADVGTLAIVAQWCQARSLTPRSLSLGHRTLEDVFLDLTGADQ